MLDINDRTVCIFLSGPSLKQTDSKFLQFPFLKVSINRFDLVADVLGISPFSFDVVWLSFEERYKKVSHLLPDYQGVVITTSSEKEKLSQLGARNIITSDYGYGFASLFALIVCLIRTGAKKILLFGADGGGPASNLYIHQQDMSEDLSRDRWNLQRDTKVMNDLFWRLLDYWGVPSIEIINMNPKSLLTCFKKAEGE